MRVVAAERACLNLAPEINKPTAQALSDPINIETIDPLLQNDDLQNGIALIY